MTAHYNDRDAGNAKLERELRDWIDSERMDPGHIASQSPHELDTWEAGYEACLSQLESFIAGPGGQSVIPTQEMVAPHPSSEVVERFRRHLPSDPRMDTMTNLTFGAEHVRTILATIERQASQLAGVVGERDAALRERVALAIERADRMKVPDGYADGATGAEPLLHDEISDWGAYLADVVLLNIPLAALSPNQGAKL